MDLVERYVNTVAKALPEEQRDDIVGELSEDIRSEMDDKQKELGRPLTEAEQEAILKQRGNPWLLAARYRQDQRSVAFGREIIGPVLFPFYIKVLSFNLGLTFVVLGTIFLALELSGEKVGFNSILSNCLLQLFIQFGVVTLIFSVVQKHLKEHPDRWHFKKAGAGLALGDKMPQRENRAQIGRKGAAAAEVSRFESISIIVACAVAIAWLTEVQNYQVLILGPAAAFLKLAPIWSQIYFPVLLLTVAEIVRAAINLVEPGWVRFRMVCRVLVHAGGLAVAYFLFRAGTWVAAVDSVGNPSANYGNAVGVINRVLYWALLCAIFLSAAQLVYRMFELLWRWNGNREARNVGSVAKEGN